MVKFQIRNSKNKPIIEAEIILLRHFSKGLRIYLHGDTFNIINKEEFQNWINIDVIRHRDGHSGGSRYKPHDYSYMEFKINDYTKFDMVIV